MTFEKKCLYIKRNKIDLYPWAIWIILVFELTAMLKLEITVCLFWPSLPVHSGSLIIRNWPVWPILFLLNVFNAL